MAKEDVPGSENTWTETVRESQTPAEKKVSSKKKKFSVVNVIALILLLLLVGVVAFYFLSDTTEVSQCESTDQCSIYDVFYFKGSGYVCANENPAEGSFKDKVLMFKYASANGQDEEPEGCSCVENRCQTN